MRKLRALKAHVTRIENGSENWSKNWEDFFQRLYDRELRLYHDKLDESLMPTADDMARTVGVLMAYRVDAVSLKVRPYRGINDELIMQGTGLSILALKRLSESQFGLTYWTPTEDGVRWTESTRMDTKYKRLGESKFLDYVKDRNIMEGFVLVDNWQRICAVRQRAGVESYLFKREESVDDKPASSLTKHSIMDATEEKSPSASC